MIDLAYSRPTPARRLVSALSDVRTLAVVAALGMAAPAVGCSDDTGIIIEVTRDADKSPEGIVELVFYVGTPMAGEDDTYLRDPSDADTVLLDAGRDILAEPYRMLLRPSDGFDDEIGAVVLGYTADRDQVVIGALDRPVPFVDDTVAVWPVTLRWSSQIRPTPTGCLSWTSEQDGGGAVVIAPGDLDCDGDGNATDCAPANPTIGHGQPEDCDNGIDDNCNDATDEPNDLDDDGYFDCEDDCDDHVKEIHPGAEEECDGVDTDCDGDCDADLDDDGYTSCTEDTSSTGSCFQPAPGDCDDAAETVHPDQADTCELGANETVDNDCDELCDEDADGDGDTFTPCGAIAGDCGPQLDAKIDCDDDDEHVFPGNPEVCDGVDNDCDGERFQVPDGARCYSDAAGGCHSGDLICVDQTGGPDPGLSCDVNNDVGTVAPAEACDAYEACLDTGAGDPFACANGAIGETASSVACTIAYTVDGDDICSGGAVDLPPPPGDPPLCGWRVLGRPVNDSYEVGVGSSGGGDVSGSVASCDLAAFFVLATVDFPPTSDAVLLWQHSGLSTLALYRVALTPVVVDECPVNPLTCTFE